MNGIQRMAAIMAVWIASMGALTVLFSVSNLIWPPTWALILSSILFLAAATIGTYFITRSQAPTA